MKHVSIRLAVLLAVVLVRPVWPESASVLLQEGIYEEETVGDLDKAIGIYQQIVTETEAQLTTAAMAQYRLGMCYLKKGQHVYAVAAFEKLIKQFPQEQELVTQARQQLDALNQSGTGPVQRKVWDYLPGSSINLKGVSQDGQFLTYIDWTTGNLVIRDMKTGRNKILTENENYEQWNEESVISPDSQWIAYNWRVEKGLYELRVINKDGSNMRVLHHDKKLPWLCPCDWTPDGKQILVQFSSDDSETQKLGLVSLNDASVRFIDT